VTNNQEMKIHQVPLKEKITFSESQFYSFYRWCLNPILTLHQLFERLNEELKRYASFGVGWQQEEGRINLFLFVCAIACTVDDYLAWRPWSLSSAASQFPRFRFVVLLIEKLLNFPNSFLGLFRDRSIIRWRNAWDESINHVSTILVNQLETTDDEWVNFKMQLLEQLNAVLPERLLKRRMKLPEGFRCQDLTHHDVFTLTQKFLASEPDKNRTLLVIGIRTAGSYFAPLVKSYVETLGWNQVSFIAIRPKQGLSRREKKMVRAVLRKEPLVLLIDDNPNTGKTFRLTLTLLKRFGVSAKNITILAPRHPVRPDWTLPEETKQGVTIILLDPPEYHKENLLHPNSVESLLREYSLVRGRTDFKMRETSQVDQINSFLHAHYVDGFHVRLKRVFEIEIRPTSITSEANVNSVVKRIFAKSVGWGWLGYHAYVAGTRLSGFVPPLIGLRNGFLFTEWLENGKDKRVGDCEALEGKTVKTIASYVSRRAQDLRLDEDPCFENPEYGWTGWDEIINILRGMYGPYIGRLKASVLRQSLRKYVSPIPTLVDGRMNHGDWIETRSGLFKVDFEQHNFGGAELYIVDPAYDLAVAIFEFNISEYTEQKLLQTYIRETGDQTIGDRIFIYKLLHGIRTMKIAANMIARDSSHPKSQYWNLNYLKARNFLTHQMHKFCSNLTIKPLRTEWHKNLLFLDLDGVFDRELYNLPSFPHTTISGLKALVTLQSHEFSVVPNTGRSVEHVRKYCQTYGLPGGIAEYGSVFLDAVGQYETSLINAKAAKQLVLCREAVRKIPGVFIDPGYHYSIRLYRYKGQRTRGLSENEVQELLDRNQCTSLTYIHRLDDTYIVQKGVDKGAGLFMVKKYRGCMDNPVAAIGDSEEDLPMLEAAEFGYATANCSDKVRRSANTASFRITDKPYQQGLLAVAKDLVCNQRSKKRTAVMKKKWDSGIAFKFEDSSDIMQALLQVADRSRFQHLVKVLHWRTL